MSRAAGMFTTARFEWKRAWAAYLGVGLLLAAAAAAEWRNVNHAKQGPIEIVTISGFGPDDTGSGKVIVVGSNFHGLNGQATITADRVRGCKVGDPIEAERVGGYLRLHPKPCT